MSINVPAANPVVRVLTRTKTILEMIKFEHSVFALPFALIAAIVAGHRIPAIATLLWIVVAMVGARSAAMSFNRIADWRYDALNPRTSNRAIPAGTLTVAQVWVFTVVASAVLVLAAYKLGRLAFELSPLALILALGYSWTKRFTALSHAFLGLALSVAPMGAWIAVTNRFDTAPMLLAAAVLLWLFGFDILYALQDTEFDGSVGLHSIPAKFGPKRAIVISRIGHALMVVFLALFGIAAHLHAIYFAGVVFVTSMVAWEQSLVKHDDLSKLNFAFFNLNGYISVGLFFFTLADVLVPIK